MPIPKPESGELEQDYIGRCMSKLKDEYPDQSQRYAICISQYQMKEEMSKKEKIFVLQPRKSENRGMYLSRCSNNSKMKSQFPLMKERMGFCLNSFNEYYKYWNKMDFAEVPEDSALGLCIAKMKSKGFDYKESYARCATKIGSPALGAGQSINLSDDLLVEPVEFAEMNILGYPTKHFDICPGAQATFKHLLEMVQDEETAGMIRSAAQVADNIFKLESDVIEKEKATQEDVQLAQILVNDFYDIIEEIDEETDMIHDVSYMDGHIEKIKQYL